MDRPRWLLAEEDLEIITHQDDGWVVDFLLNNGITSEELADWIMGNIRNEHELPDCPHCKSIDKHYRLKNGQWKCKKCRKKFILTTGTYLHHTKLKNHEIIRFAYLIGVMKITNSYSISKDIGIAQKTAWKMLDLLRRARRETIKRNFINGHDVLSFENDVEVLMCLLQKRITDKICSSCNKEKPLSSFGLRTKEPKTHLGVCTECTRIRSNKYHEDHKDDPEYKEKNRQRQKEYDDRTQYSKRKREKAKVVKVVEVVEEVKKEPVVVVKTNEKEVEFSLDSFVKNGLRSPKTKGSSEIIYNKKKTTAKTLLKEERMRKLYKDREKDVSDSNKEMFGLEGGHEEWQMTKMNHSNYTGTQVRKGSP